MMSFVISGRKGKSKNQRQLITGHLSLKKVVCSVRKSLVLCETGNVLAVSIKRLNTKALSAIAVVLRLLYLKCDVNAWRILISPFLSFISGSLKLCHRALVTFLV